MCKVWPTDSFSLFYIWDMTEENYYGRFSFCGTHWKCTTTVTESENTSSYHRLLQPRKCSEWIWALWQRKNIHETNATEHVPSVSSLRSEADSRERGRDGKMINTTRLCTHAHTETHTFHWLITNVSILAVHTQTNAHLSRLKHVPSLMGAQKKNNTELQLNGSTN